MEVKIDNFSFGPVTLTVPVGTTVTWTNRDDIPHTVVSTDDPKTFKSKVLDTDEKFSFTFSKAGTYPYFCAIHPKMTGKVIVQLVRSDLASLRHKNGTFREARATRRADPLPDCVVYDRRSLRFRFPWAMEEAAPAGRGGLLQLARRGDRNHSVVATGILAWRWELERQKLKGILLMHLLMKTEEFGDYKLSQDSAQGDQGTDNNRSDSEV